MTEVVLSDEKFEEMSRRVREANLPRPFKRRGFVVRQWMAQDKVLVDAGYSKEEVKAWRDRLMKEKNEEVAAGRAIPLSNFLMHV